MLSERARFARQILVPEIGDEGQARLSSSTFDLRPLGPEAAAVARLYLERAGLREAGSEPQGPAQVPAEAALAGARFAVARIRAALDESAPA